MESIKEKYNKIVIPEMKKKFGYKTKLAVPKILKVSINIGTGSLKDEKKREVIEKSLTAITGQKPSVCSAKKSIASFKLRQGMPIGYKVTLRGQRMYDFLNKLINVALPRTRDFKGLKSESIDKMGNFTMGIKEHTIFAETGNEEISKIFGFEITIATSAKNKEEALELLKLLGFPFKKII